MLEGFPAAVKPMHRPCPLQWNLRRKDTLVTALLSFLRKLSLSRRFMKYFNFITFHITGWNISNVVKFVHELVCKIVK